ncbi:MAG: nitroreductase family protein [Desulfovibrio sp.]|nr:nitroreductase family protein [Desulfovibrio sp.]
MKHLLLTLCLVLALALTAPFAGAASGGAAEKRMTLPKPTVSGGMPLMNALAARKSTRSFDSRAISEQNLSNLLWAAWGINRTDGKRTVPTSRNRQEAALFAVLESGVWRYEAADNSLTLVVVGDARGRFGGAPLTLIFAAKAGDDGGMHAGSMYQNVGLYCASVGLGNVVKTTGRAEFAPTQLKLPDEYKVYVVQSVGWPK